MTDKTITSFDDYYAHIPTPTSIEEDASKKKGLKLKVKAKKIEETPTKEVLAASPEAMDENAAQKTATKDKKSTVAIIWSPKDHKKEGHEAGESVSSDAPKPVPRDVLSHTPREQKKTPFVPRVSFSPAPQTSPVKKDETKTPFVFAPRSSESGGAQKKVFGNNKPKGGTGKSPFSFGERHGGKKTLKTR